MDYIDGYRANVSSGLKHNHIYTCTYDTMYIDVNFIPKNYTFMSHAASHTENFHCPKNPKMETFWAFQNRTLAQNFEHFWVQANMADHSSQDVWCRPR